MSPWGKFLGMDLFLPPVIPPKTPVAGCLAFGKGTSKSYFRDKPKGQGLGVAWNTSVYLVAFG